jgi:hypothetical protein
MHAGERGISAKHQGPSHKMVFSCSGKWKWEAKLKLMIFFAFPQM